MTTETTSASKVNPTIIAYGLGYKELFRKPLSEVQGMAYGVREDYENGSTKLTVNQCTARESDRVFAWGVAE